MYEVNFLQKINLHQFWIIKHADLLFTVQKNTKSVNLKLIKTNNGRPTLSSKCAVCGSKKLRFVKKQEAKVLLGNLGFKTALSKVPLLGDIFLSIKWMK